MARYLVTGAAGFIGSHVAEVLLLRGDRVIGLDNLNDYYSPQQKLANVAVLRAHENFAFLRGDIREDACLEQVGPIDGIVHLGAMAGVRASVEQPAYYYDVNLLGTLKLLQMAQAQRVRQFVFASTSSVYGRTQQIPFVETDSADRPLAPYPASKRAAELLGHSFFHLHQVPFVALRFFTVYGPRGRPDMVAYRLLDSMFFGAEMPLYNGGQMYRDWTYVADIAAGVVAALDSDLTFEIINLGRGEPVLLQDFVEHIERLVGRRAEVHSAPMLAADIEYTYADITKAKRLLGYRPRVSVAEGTARFWEWYRSARLSDSKDS
jgi:UDP-glucuronate 4-epimerase